MSAAALTPPPGVELLGPRVAGDDQVLTPAALDLVATLARRFTGRLEELLERRHAVQARLDAGERLHFLPETADLRDAHWSGASIPDDLADRRVEITGPVDRKMIINALNSGANVFMADFEDSNTPTWENQVSGQVNLKEAVRRAIRHVAPETGKLYELSDNPATLMVRPRGWHLPERHVLVDGRPVPGSLFDFGLYFFHNVRALRERGTGPYFYLPKLESHLEARLWNDVFTLAQRELDVPSGTIRATVLIETIPAAFEMDEILYELRDHTAGLNCGRWDYIFSFIKKHRGRKEYVLPDRGQVTMAQPFMRAYTQLLIRTCHRRGVHAMGGMAAQIPIKGDSAANDAALEKVRADKLREVRDGHDGTWVAHPGLVPVARAVFDAHMPGANQIGNRRLDFTCDEADLLRVPEGTRTETGLRQNVHVAVLYLESWLRGTGCVPLFDLMEDAATAEISRAQIWQWLHHRAALDDGRVVTRDLVGRVFDEEIGKIRAAQGDERFEAGRFAEARQLFEDLCTSDGLADFLTVPAYERVLTVAR